MLVLSRKLGEKVLIDGDIAITVVEISGGRIKLGIEAPRDRQVLRGELQAKSAPAIAPLAVPAVSPTPCGCP